MYVNKKVYYLFCLKSWLHALGLLKAPQKVKVHQTSPF